MPKRRKSQLIQCANFAWRLVCRQSVWYADGRSNMPSVGRHTLATKDLEEARRVVRELDQRIAEEIGLIPPTARADQPHTPLSLAERRRLYEEHLKRPRSVGGVKPSTCKRYKTVFDKFIPFAESQHVHDWRDVDAVVLTRYASYLEKLPRSHKTQINELVVLIQAIKWMISAKHLLGKEPIKLELKKAESQRAYCWKPEEVTAIVEFCRASEKLEWLGDIVIALACTGLRISELAALRWTDVDFVKRLLHLPDESGFVHKAGSERRDRKSGRSRSFPIHPNLLAVLVRRRQKGTHVFHGTRGGRLKPDYVRNVLISKVIAHLALRFPASEGVQSFADGRLHSFRHYFCSLCANNNVPERMVMEWLGHKDSAMVRHYYHMNDAEAKRQMDKLNPLGNDDKKSAC